MDSEERSTLPRAIYERCGACRQCWDGRAACVTPQGRVRILMCARRSARAPRTFPVPYRGMLRRRSPLSLGEIVEGGLCIGCGLCRAVAGADHIQIVLTPEGRERPVARRPLDESTLERINAICPGTRIEGAAIDAGGSRATHDLVWGPAEHLAIGYAADPEVRYRASTGGVLTALGQFLLASGRAKFILHVAASGTEPMRTKRALSFDAASILEGAGSRYGPAAPLIDFTAFLGRGAPCA